MTKVSTARTAALSDGGGATTTTSLLPAKGDVIGEKYRIEGVLGEGGMGVVLSARHVRLGHMVALKLLRADDRTGERTARLLREGRAASTLRSPHVARVLDVELLADGQPYLVLEYLEGETLSERLRRGRALPEREAIEVLIQAALGVAEAHARGIVHRDVKPGNIFLVRGDETCAKVLDFGIASPPPSDDTRLTAEATVLGSTGYMAPEQLRGARDVDARADVWALGITLYEALTAELPFQGASSRAMSASIAADPPRPLGPRASAAVAAVVASCLEKDPEKRCPSALSFVEQLAALLPSGEAYRLEARALGSVKSDAPSAAPRPTRRWFLPASAVGAAALAIAIASVARQPPKATVTTPEPAEVKAAPASPAIARSNVPTATPDGTAQTPEPAPQQPIKAAPSTTPAPRSTARARLASPSPPVTSEATTTPAPEPTIDRLQRATQNRL